MQQPSDDSSDTWPRNILGVLVHSVFLAVVPWSFCGWLASIWTGQILPVTGALFGVFYSGVWAWSRRAFENV